MIITLTGENSFALRHELQRLTNDFLVVHGDMGLERLDGQEADFSQLQEAIQGLPFLVAKKLVVLKNPGAQKQFADTAETLLSDLPEATDIIIVEPKLDKRLNYYKFLKKSTDFREYNELDPGAHATWLIQKAGLSHADARYLVERVGPDQQMLAQEIEKLQLAERPINRQLIDELVSATPQANAFDLLDAALHGNSAKVKQLLVGAVASEDPYRLFGLVVSQISALSLVVAGKGKSPAEIATLAGVHPFVIKKLAPLARRYSWTDMTQVIGQVASADDQLKGSGADPWVVIETLLMKIATRV